MWFIYIYIYGYGSIPIHTIFSGMNIHLPAILMFTRGTRFWHTAIYIYILYYIYIYIDHEISARFVVMIPTDGTPAAASHSVGKMLQGLQDGCRASCARNFGDQKTTKKYGTIHCKHQTWGYHWDNAWDLQAKFIWTPVSGFVGNLGPRAIRVRCGHPMCDMFFFGLSPMLIKYPLVNIQKAIENDHRNRGFTH